MDSITKETVYDDVNPDDELRVDFVAGRNYSDYTDKGDSVVSPGKNVSVTLFGEFYALADERIVYIRTPEDNKFSVDLSSGVVCRVTNGFVGKDLIIGDGAMVRNETTR